MSHMKHYARNCMFTSALLLLGSSPALADDASVMVLEGTTAAPFDNGEFAVLDGRFAWNTARWEEWQKTAKSDETAPNEAYGAIAWVPIGSDGTFRLEIPVDKPRVATFAVMNAKTADGNTFKPNKHGNNFILEPGELKLRMIRYDYSEITGGHYNDAVFNSWRLSQEYKQAQADAEQARADFEQAEAELGAEPLPGDDPREQARRRLWDLRVEASQQVIRLEEQGMSKVALTHPDPLARRFAIEASWIVGPWQADALRSLARLTPDDPWVAKMLRSSGNVTTISFLGAGDDVPDFTGETLTGTEVRLADVQSGNRYVLVEFWASWCGPCRAEIPHMKQAYARFRDKGFEIVSFTVDEEREDWEVASAEEELPWIDIGMGFETEAAQAYSIRNRGIPRNYLVESSTGTIVAADLRRHKLDEKLEELLQ